MSTSSIKVDVAALTRFAGDLGKIGTERLSEVLVDTINEQADSAYELSRKTILGGINLTENYVERKMEREAATKTNLTASIIAPVGRGYFTNASHYGAVAVTQPVNTPNSAIKKFGPWPGWTRRIGTAHAGIAPDEKLQKTSVEVVRGARKSIGKKFTLPGIKDRDGNPLLFRGLGGSGGSRARNTDAGFNRKTGRQKIEPVMGPSVYQLFRVAIPKVRDNVEADLQRAVLDAAERAFIEALK